MIAARHGADLRVAAVGTGYFSQFHYDAWRRLGVRVVGVCSLDPAEAETVAATFESCEAHDRFEAMLDSTKPDLVDIIAPPPSHLEMIKAAVSRRIPVVCQKPFTRSLEEARQAVGIARDADVPLIVHENFRFQPWHMKIKEMLTAGMIGEPYQVTFRLRPGDGQGPDAYLNRQPYFQQMERFLIHETAIHLIDVFRYLFGEVTSVQADLVRRNPVIAGEDGGIVILAFANGARGLFDGNRLSDHIAENRRLTIGDMLVEGSRGTIRLNGHGEVFHRPFGENVEVQAEFARSDRGFAGDSVFNLNRHVAECLASGGKFANTAEEYLENLRVEEAVYESHRLGQRVTLMQEHADSG